MHRIMIVEDEKNLLELYKHELEDEGYKVISCNNGESVMDSIKSC